MNTQRFFYNALPVWPLGREKEMNLSVGFTVRVGKGDFTLLITAATLYRLFVNGKFAAYGPARAPHGYTRVDSIPLGSLLTQAENLVAIEVAGYNVNSFYTLNRPSFLQAEIRENDKVICATGKDDFSAMILDARVQKVERISHARAFGEIYYLDRNNSALSWYYNPRCSIKKVKLSAQQPNYKFLPRGVPMPRFDTIAPEKLLEQGRVIRLEHKAEFAYRKNCTLKEIGPNLLGYKEHELKDIPSLTLQDISWESSDDPGATDYLLYDFGRDWTGFIGFKLTCREDAEVFFVFGETLVNGRLAGMAGMNNIVKYSFKAHESEYDAETFEPYTFRYLGVLTLKGKIILKDIYLREYAYPVDDKGVFRCSDNNLNALFKAAFQTYRQNTVDTFMDCPHRERGAWLCDSFFIARASFAFSGSTLPEDVFIENYLRAEEFPHLPEGMLPMCYPADHPTGSFIPQWPMWLILQIDEYVNRLGSARVIEQFRPRIMALLAYYKKHENESGLLENLPGWNFIEWSDANLFVGGVHYPTNMLYAKILELAGRWYDLPELISQVKYMRDHIIEQSFDGDFFVDNAGRDPLKKIARTENRSEICQYFAFYFDVASPADARFGKLFNTLVHDFGPERKKNNAWPKISSANAFVGYYLRLEVLSRSGHVRQLLAECIKYFLPMAEATGTLWEMNDSRASCCHGFASHIGFVLIRDVLGIKEINNRTMTVKLAVPDLDLDYAEGRISTRFGDIKVRWEKAEGKIQTKHDIPKAYVLVS